MSNFNVNYFYKFELFLLTSHYSQPPTPNYTRKYGLKRRFKSKKQNTNLPLREKWFCVLGIMLPCNNGTTLYPFANFPCLSFRSAITHIQTMISHCHTSRYMRIHNVFIEVSALFFAFLCPPSFLLRFCLVSTILLRKICRCVAATFTAILLLKRWCIR